MHRDQVGVETLGHARRATHEPVAVRRPREGDQHTLARLPGLGDAVTGAVLREALLDPVGDPEERQLAQRSQVAGAEVVAEGGVDALGRVDVAAREPRPDRLDREVDELQLVGAPHDLVGDRLALHDTGDLLHHVVEGLEVLDVEVGDDADPRVEQLLDVLPALLVAAARARSCARARRRAPAAADARGARRGPSPRRTVSRYVIVARGTTSSSPTCSAVLCRPCDSMNPTTTSSPRARRRRPSFSMA